MNTRSLVNRARKPGVALETTILVHGLPSDRTREAADLFGKAVRDSGASPALVGVVEGAGVVGMSDDELDAMLRRPNVPKVNRSNLGLTMASNAWGATTVSATVELAALAGLRVFATGGIGGVHRGYSTHLDVSSDLTAIASHPVAVVTSGCKNILDIRATREALETLGVTVVGFCCDAFPAFYQRSSDAALDARFDTAEALAEFVRFELARSGRGIVVCNPIPPDDEIPADQWEAWLTAAQAEHPAIGRDATPALLESVHRFSDGRTIEANIALARSNASLAGRLASAMHRG